MFLQDLDVERIQARHRAFWQREVLDRVCIAVTAPAAGPHRPWPQPRDDEQLLTDPAFAVERALAAAENTYYAGDALPTATARGNLLYPALGGAGRIESRTVWVDPTVHAWQEWADYRVAPDNPWAERFLAVNRALAEASRGRYLVSTEGFFGATDALALIRGYEGFLVDLLDEEAEAVLRQAQARAIAGHVEIIRRAWRDVTPFQAGTVTPPCIWAPGTVNYWSADVSCLISAAAFDRWLVPEFEAEIRLCDFSLYHLDGPNAVRHLPRIAELPGLHAIQYTPPPDSDPDHWLAVAREIQRLGKATYVCARPETLDRVLAELDPRGLFIVMSAQTPEEADDAVRRCAAGTRPRRRP